jgi:hypothetical protein
VGGRRGRAGAAAGDPVPGGAARGAGESRGLRAMTDRLRAHLDQVHRDVARQHQALRAHARTATGRDPGPDPRWAELARLHAEGQRLHREDTRLRAARDRGTADAGAAARFRTRLAAHRAALQRFRGGGDARPATSPGSGPAPGGTRAPARPARPAPAVAAGPWTRVELESIHRATEAPRARLARLRAARDRRREHLLSWRAAGAAARAGTDRRRAELFRPWAEGEALHVEDEHLRALRALGDVDPGAHARLLERLAAHRAALRRFLGGPEDGRPTPASGRAEASAHRWGHRPAAGTRSDWRATRPPGQRGRAPGRYTPRAGQAPRRSEGRRG